MKKDFRILGMMLGLALGVLALGTLASILFFQDEPVTVEPVPAEDVITGTVVGFEFRENQAEDGFYSIQVETEEGEVTINATAFMNTPQSPEAVGQKCLAIPEGKELQDLTVTFKLPLAESASTPVYNVCFETSNPEGYFFTLGESFPAEN